MASSRRCRGPASVVAVVPRRRIHVSYTTPFIDASRTDTACSAGKHVVPNTWVVPAFRARGYHVVSAAYRFIPHANMRDIVADCSDSLAWCRANLPKLLGSSKLDLDAYVVGGDSAGGTLATLAGHRFTPRPRVVLDVFGVTDPADTGLTIPPPDGTYMAERARWFPLSGKFSEDDVQAALRDRERAHAVTICPWTWEMPPNMDQATLRSFWGTPDFVLDDSHYLRMDMMCVVNRDRQLFRVLARGETPQDDPKTDAELRSALAEFSALKLLDGAKGYPPTFFMHGEKDQTVPVAQSKAMADKLRGMGVVVGEAYSPDGDHCFDNVIEVSEPRAARVVDEWVSEC